RRSAEMVRAVPHSTRTGQRPAPPPHASRFRPRPDVRGGQVDVDQSLHAQPEHPEDDLGWITRHSSTDAQRAVDRVLELQPAATDVVSDIDDLNDAGGSADECDPGTLGG